jgi:hypothetical protein
MGTKFNEIKQDTRSRKHGLLKWPDCLSRFSNFTFPVLGSDLEH